MGNKTLIYKQKVLDNLNESYRHLQRIDDSISELQQRYPFPLTANDFGSILQDKQMLAFSDQCIYRFSKLQDCMGAKLFKSILLYQGENVNKPFLDILNQLEAMNILNVDEWFEIRDLRNEIAHDYANHDNVAIEILNAIYKIKNELELTLNTINKIVFKKEFVREI
ncbi:hypothetical protein [Sulfurimonas sp.]